MSKKIYRVKVWVGSFIHFEAEDHEEALSLTTRYFSHHNHVEVEYVREVDREGVDPEQVFDSTIVPDITLN